MGSCHLSAAVKPQLALLSLLKQRLINCAQKYQYKPSKHKSANIWRKQMVLFIVIELKIEVIPPH